jgi:pimeloyl-ACP methyl ester carboxylesterase
MVRANGLNMHIAEAGTGPLVLLLHGFPELWHSFRRQLAVLADAGYHAVAPDQRGYGRTDAPPEVAKYTLLHLTGDMVGLISALGYDRTVVVGQDWGSPVATSVALLRPDLVRGVVLLSTPYTPRDDVDFLTDLTARLGPDNYQTFFQEPGVAEPLLEADVRATVIGALVGVSGDAPEVHTTAGVTARSPRPEIADALPQWLTEEDVDYLTAEFTRTGYRGALNWYRNHQANWELMAAWHQAPVVQPSLFVGGDRDPVLNWPGFRELAAHLGDRFMPNLTGNVVLPGCGHWLQLERPEEVNRLLLDFVTALD